MNEIERAIRDCKEQIASIDAQVDTLDAQIEALRFKRAEFAGELRGLELAVGLLVPSDPAPAPKRRAVQGPVMAAFSPGEAWTLSQLLDRIHDEDDDLPEAAIRDCLGRAVRLGKLILSEAGYYSLPPPRRRCPAPGAML